MLIGDYVTRKSYNNDIVFKIVDIKNNIAVLKGEEIRLIADSPLIDLEKFDNKIKVLLPKLIVKDDVNNIKGKILHLDGDPYYLKKAMEAYSFYNVKAVGYYVKEQDMKYAIIDLLKKDSFDILVLTGHDSFQINQEDGVNNLTSYRNSYNYLLAVIEARKLYPDKDNLVVVAGACQSYYEALIDAGANFASSPNRKNIHLLDPIIIASTVALTRTSEYVNVQKLLDSTISHEIGGIETKGKARKNFVGGKKDNDG